MTFPLDNLIPQIVSEANLIHSYDYVIAHLENRFQREKYRADAEPMSRYEFATDEDYAKYQYRQKRAKERRENILTTLLHELSTGTFTITRADVKDVHVTDGPKERDCQSPSVIKRVGGHSIMEVVERHLYTDLIATSAACVKGKGMHWLHHRIEEDMRHVPDKFGYFYKCDIRKYYDSIDQERMKAMVREYISDPLLLPMLDSFVDLMDEGLSKGLRSSQGLGNMYLNGTHKDMLGMAERYFLILLTGEIEVRYLYYVYCDDTVMVSPSKRHLWAMRDEYVQKLHTLGLEIKPDEAVRPISEGLDMAGFIHYLTHSRLRKRTKQNAARKLSRMKSRRRRQEVIGSFKGMAIHGDCKNLYYTLTHHHMKKFSELGITYKPTDGKKRFPGRVMRLSALQNKLLEIYDYETEISTSQGDGRCIVSFKDSTTGEWGKFFTTSVEMQNILDQVAEADEFPFETIILSEIFDGNKTKYIFS